MLVFRELWEIQTKHRVWPYISTYRVNQGYVHQWYSETIRNLHLERKGGRGCSVHCTPPHCSLYSQCDAPCTINHNGFPCLLWRFICNSFTTASLRIHTCVLPVSSLLFCAHKKTGTEKERDRCAGRDREGKREEGEREVGSLPFLLSFSLFSLSICLSLSLFVCPSVQFSLSSPPSFFLSLTLKYSNYRIDLSFNKSGGSQVYKYRVGCTWIQKYR